jgi:hypothetical protein
MGFSGFAAIRRDEKNINTKAGALRQAPAFFLPGRTFSVYLEIVSVRSVMVF